MALVNTNRIMPPISSLELEYVAETLFAVGHEVSILDLCWEEQRDGFVDGGNSDCLHGICSPFGFLPRPR